ncbi:MAG: endonuclease Q family protein [Planctomycetota bacterium]|jgi:PHP family Zn ribbon phosphoesterase|nr:endonuclease Q family protein [Planctomycetota bacterium]
MRYVVDLHSHSGYAGGVGDISLPAVARTMARKGIDAFGVGDCLQPAWRENLSTLLVEREEGLFALRDAPPDLAGARFVLQTEVIFTCAVPSGGRKGTHVVLTFPGFDAVDRAIALLRRWEVKLDIGRPFVKCEDAGEVAEKCHAVASLDPTVMIIPAHVLTPQGVYGSDHPVDNLKDVFGGFAREIRAVETGLSADPGLLALLPELDGLTLVSNSDCHSGALNRVGREFTALSVPSASYPDIAGAIARGAVEYTAEFNPAEGRYFLTGHKAGLERHGDAYCYFSPDRTPKDGLCPICGKKLTIGVLERILGLSRAQSPDGVGRAPGSAPARQRAVRLVPLVEVVAAGLGVRNVSSKKAAAVFDLVLDRFRTELLLWEQPPETIAAELTGAIPDSALVAILQVRRGDFSFRPGFDGTYGGLVLGRTIDWYGHAEIVRPGAR